MKNLDGLLDTKLSDIEGLSIEDRILRLELCVQMIMKQDAEVIELVNSTIEQLNELREQVLIFMKKFVDDDNEQQSENPSWWS